MEFCTFKLPPSNAKAPPKLAPVLLLKVDDMTLTVDELATMTNAVPDTMLPTQHTNTMAVSLNAHGKNERSQASKPRASDTLPQFCWYGAGLRTIDAALREIVHAIGDVEHTELLEIEVCQDKCIKIHLHDHVGLICEFTNQARCMVASDAHLLPAHRQQRLSRRIDAEIDTCRAPRITASHCGPVNPPSQQTSAVVGVGGRRARRASMRVLTYPSCAYSTHKDSKRGAGVRHRLPVAGSQIRCVQTCRPGSTRRRTRGELRRELLQGLCSGHLHGVSRASYTRSLHLSR